MDWRTAVSKEGPAALFELATELNARLHLEIPEGNENGIPLHLCALPVSSSKTRVVVRLLPEYMGVAISPGARVDAYFFMGGHDRIHVSCSTRVVECSGGWIILAMPSRVMYSQRRNAFRINCGKEDIGSVVVYAVSERKWRRLRDDCFEVIDVSANGLQLEVLESDPLYPELRPDSYILFRGLWSAPADKRRQASLLLAGKIVRQTILENKRKRIGVCLLRFKKSDKDAGWQKIQATGHPVLRAWCILHSAKNRRNE